MLSHRVLGSRVRELGCAWAQAVRQHAAADNARMETLIRHARQVCTAVVGAAVAMVTMAASAALAAPSSVQTQVYAFDGHRVTLDVYPAVGPLRGASILSHGFTRSRRTLAGHAQALADAGVLACWR